MVNDSSESDKNLLAYNFWDELILVAHDFSAWYTLVCITLISENNKLFEKHSLNILKFCQDTYSFEKQPWKEDRDQSIHYKPISPNMKLENLEVC